MTDTLEKTIDKMVNGSTTDQQLDFYIAANLPESVMTIIDVF